MDHSSKQRQLEELRERIKRTHASMNPPRKVWFWPDHWDEGGARGFIGTAPTPVLGLNPSDPKGDEYTPFERWNERSKWFYRTLREDGFGGAHLSDVFKQRSQRDDLPLLTHNSSALIRHKAYLVAEAEIIKPAVVVVMGFEALNVLRGMGLVVGTTQEKFRFASPSGLVPIKLTYHPYVRYQKMKVKVRAKFKRDLREARKIQADRQ